MGTVLGILVAILMLEVIVTAHEFGHFLMARKLGFTVAEFAVGIGPKLYSRTTKNNMVFSFRLLPLGGYCRFLDDEDEDRPEGSVTFSEQKPWKRILVLISGGFANLVSAVLIGMLLFGFVGNIFAPLPYVEKVTQGSSAQIDGVLPGDTIVWANGREVASVQELNASLPKGDTIIDGQAFDIVVMRDKTRVPLTLHWQVTQENKYRMGVTFEAQGNQPLLINHIEAGSAAEITGLQVGDVVTSANGVKVKTVQELTKQIPEQSSIQEGQAFQLVVLRGSEEKALTLHWTKQTYDVPQPLGIGYGQKFPKLSVDKVFTKSVDLTWTSLDNTVKALGQIFKGNTENVGGIVGVVAVVGEDVGSVGLFVVLFYAVLLSANLALINLLPLPALDGGRLIFAIIEAIRRKRVNPKIEGIVHMIGFGLLLVLFLLLTYSDILRLIGVR